MYDIDVDIFVMSICYNIIYIYSFVLFYENDIDIKLINNHPDLDPLFIHSHLGDLG